MRTEPQTPQSLLDSPHVGEALYPHILRNAKGTINPIQFNWVLSRHNSY